MKRELGIAKCGLACCLCSQNGLCGGCRSGNCPKKDTCEVWRCTQSRGLDSCAQCPEDCRKGILRKTKPYAFTQFVRRYGERELLDRLEQNEKKGVLYHQSGFQGDYDTFDRAEDLISFLQSGETPLFHDREMPLSPDKETPLSPNAEKEEAP